MRSGEASQIRGVWIFGAQGNHDCRCLVQCGCLLRFESLSFSFLMVLYVGMPSIQVNICFGKDSMYVSGEGDVMVGVGWAVLVGCRF